MDKYLIAIIALIIFSIFIILFVRISSKIFNKTSQDSKLLMGDDSNNYDNTANAGLLSHLKPDLSLKPDPLVDLKSSDFTLLE